MLSVTLTFIFKKFSQSTKDGDTCTIRQFEKQKSIGLTFILPKKQLKIVWHVKNIDKNPKKKHLHSFRSIVRSIRHC